MFTITLINISTVNRNYEIIKVGLGVTLILWGGGANYVVPEVSIQNKKKYLLTDKKDKRRDMV